MLRYKSRDDIDQVQLENQSGLLFSFFPNGGLYRVMCGDVLINQVLGSPLEGALNNIYLRIKTRDDIQFLPLMGPLAPSRFAHGARDAVWQGQWECLAYQCSLTLHPDDLLWFWTVRVHNLRATNLVCDVIYAQDIGLAAESVVRTNEAYCSHYIDHYVFNHDRYGAVMCSRQNLACEEKHPWLMQGCTGRATGYITDGFSFYGLSYKENNVPYALTQPQLANVTRQYEMAFCGLQSEDIQIASGDEKSVTFYASYLPHHPQPTHEADYHRIEVAVSRVRQVQVGEQKSRLNERELEHTIFNQISVVTGHDLTRADLQTIFPAPRRHEEYINETLLSFFYGEATHVVLKAKEGMVERPHGHIMRSGSSLSPHDDVMSSTSYMNGVFHSHVTIGNTSFNKLVSIMRTPLNILKSSGLRIWVKRGPSYHLLGMPSCYEIGLGACRWWYKTHHGWIVVAAWMNAHDTVAYLSIEADQAQEFVILSQMVLGINELDHGGYVDIDAEKATIKLTPSPNAEVTKRYPDTVFYLTTPEPGKVEELGTDTWIFDDRQSRGLAYVTFKTKSVQTFSLVLTGSVRQADHAEALCRRYQTESISLEPEQQAVWAFYQGLGKRLRLTVDEDRDSIEKLNDLFYWYLHNAMVHYTIPHGLEQYSGAAWGVRDVCQGPVELLLATRQYAVIKAILLKVFTQQYQETADWPQWFMFDRFVDIQHPQSHGDVILWPLKALVLYLEATNDFSILDVELPYTDRREFTYTQETSSLLHHVRRVLETLEERVISGTVLLSYGEGDWNDSLQPAEATMRLRLVSSWTVSLMYQVLTQLAGALQQAGYDDDPERLCQLAERLKDDLHQYLMPDGVISGFAYFHEDGRIDHLIHPRDTRTGMQYRLLPMMRGIIGELFSPECAMRHDRIIDEHLTFPDGVRLMNQPVRYQGGVRAFFRRAEEAAYFGREIGLQYVHAHIRYIEAMCKIGRAAKAYAALLKILPIGIQDHVPNAMTRQSNAYFSSSDADVNDRYAAERNFAALRAGEVPVKGGWRVYSSGPGILLNQFISNFLGIRDYYDYVVLDPVLPMSLNGLRVAFEEDAKPVTYVFSIAHDEPAAVHAVNINGQDISFARQHNPYRQGGAMIKRSVFHTLLHSGENIVSISIAASEHQPSYP